MQNGDKTYSKTSFKESKHKRGAAGTFSKKAYTEEEDVSYHHSFSKAAHPHKSDGTFVSNGLALGIAKYGSSNS